MLHRAILLNTALRRVRIFATVAVAAAFTLNADVIDWRSNYGAEYNSVPNGSTAFSNSGAIGATLEFAGGGDGERLDQSSGWSGDFSPGDALLWTNLPGEGPITFNFNRALNSIGAQIQGDFFGDFVAMLQVFDASGNLLDSALAAGHSDSKSDGSAPFLGVSDVSGISSATFSLVSCPCDSTDFAVGPVQVSSVPEPSPMADLLAAAGLFVVSRQFRRRA